MIEERTAADPSVPAPRRAGPAIVVAIISWNTRELLTACLRSLVPDLDARRAEVWVFDNASTDGSPEAVRAEFPQVRLIASGENVGFGAGVNAVAARTESPWIAASNADIDVRPGGLAALLAAAESDDRAGAVAPRLVMPNGETQHSVHPFPTVGLSLIFNLGVHRLVPGLGDKLCIEGRWDSSRARHVDWAHGAFLLLRRRAFDGIGGFDERQWMYAEDLDLAWRLAGAGWAVRYEPRAAVGHVVSAATSQAFGHQRLARYMASTYAWMVRRRGIAITWAFAVVNLAGAAARLTALEPLAALRPARWRPGRDMVREHAKAHLRGLRSRSSLLGAR